MIPMAMQTLRHDVLYAFRTLARSPGYAALSVLTLALGIGANTAIFSVVNGVLLKPLAYPHPEQLMLISSTFPKLNFDRFWVSRPEWPEFKGGTRAFQDVGGYRVTAANLGAPERPRRVNTMLVTPELMTTVGVAPLRGRHFTADDSRPGAENVAILSHSTWQTDFGGADAAVGTVVPINGTSTRVVGIMPSGYDVHDERIEFFLPLPLDPKTFAARSGSHFLFMIGRLKPGVTPQAADADIDRLIDQWEQSSGRNHVPNRKPTTVHMIQAEPLQRDVVGAVGAALWILQGGVVFVLLIGCATLATLTLARSESRQKEFAIRSALGAS